MKFLNVLALLLILVGALNWGLWGFFQFDFVAWFAHGNTSHLARLCYAVIGLAGVWGLKFLGRCKALCGCCHKSGSSSGSGGPGDSCKM